MTFHSKPMGGELQPPVLRNVAFLRVALACLLVVTHGSEILYRHSPAYFRYIEVVPVFLFFGGYFMFASWKKSPHLGAFLLRRYLRLFPLFLIAIGASLMLLVAVHGWALTPEIWRDMPVWLLGQITLLQKYVPASFPGMGITTINGSLWFLGSILLLYASLPFVSLIEKLVPYILWILVAVSVVYMLVRTGVLHEATDRWDAAARPVNRAVFGRELEELFIPRDEQSRRIVVFKTVIDRTLRVAWMFYLGCLARRHQGWALSGPGLWVIVSCSVLLTLLIDGFQIFGEIAFQRTSPWYFPAYMAVWLTLGAALPQMRNVPPVAIGLFVWHMPLLYLLAILGRPSILLALALSFVAAVVTYHLVERPFARLVDRPGSAGSGQQRQPAPNGQDRQPGRQQDA